MPIPPPAGICAGASSLMFATADSVVSSVDATDVAEDIRKLAHVTSMVSLNQTEIEKKNGICLLKE